MRDIREMITNTFGGKMKRYERLLDVATDQAITALEAKAAEKGYDGILAVRVDILPLWMAARRWLSMAQALTLWQKPLANDAEKSLSRA